jgi:NADPH:quinone reductase-like Zn-dependent oxidoreductase
MSIKTHTAIATTGKGTFDAIEVPTKTPGRGEILLKTEYSSMIALDTYRTDLGFAVEEYPLVLGFNASGTVHEVGPEVNGLVAGDRVRLLLAWLATRQFSDQLLGYCLCLPGLKLQVYATVYYLIGDYLCKSELWPERSLFIMIYTHFFVQIPDSLPLDAAATIPDNFVTAFWSLFDQLKLTFPSSVPKNGTTVPSPPSADAAILIYGAGATSGQYAIQLLKLAGYKNILVTASSKHHSHLRNLGATHTFDYSSPSLIQDIEAAASGKVSLIMDCVTAEGTLAVTSKVISSNGTVALLLPIKQGNNVTGGADAELAMELADDRNPFPRSVKVLGVKTFTYQTVSYYSRIVCGRQAGCADST